MSWVRIRSPDLFYLATFSSSLRSPVPGLYRLSELPFVVSLHRDPVTPQGLLDPYPSSATLDPEQGVSYVLPPAPIVRISTRHKENPQHGMRSGRTVTASAQPRPGIRRTVFTASSSGGANPLSVVNEIVSNSGAFRRRLDSLNFEPCCIERRNKAKREDCGHDKPSHNRNRHWAPKDAECQWNHGENSCCCS